MTTALWRVYAERKSGHPHSGISRLDVRIMSLHHVCAQPVQPHGILGQTFDCDDKATHGRKDSISVLDDGRLTTSRKGMGGMVTKRAQGEGAIEGTVGQYHLPPFGHSFAFSRFLGSSLNKTTIGRRDVRRLGGHTEPVSRRRKLTSCSCSTPAVTTRLAGGTDWTCAISMANKLSCWGENGEAELGRGDVSYDKMSYDEYYAMSNVPQNILSNVVDVFGGEEHGCAIQRVSSTSTLYCWGDNGYQQAVPTDTNNEVLTPTAISDTILGGSPWKLPNAGDGGAEHTCIILDDGAQVMWNACRHTVSTPSLPLTPLTPLTSQLACYGDDKPDSAAGPFHTLNGVPPAGRLIYQVAVGDYHTMILLDDGTVMCWGQSRIAT